MSHILHTCQIKSKGSPIKVLIADEHPLFRAGIRKELERHSDIKVVAEVANGSEVLSQVQSYQPTVLTLGINLRQISGLEVMTHLNKKKYKSQKIPYVLVLSSYCDCYHVTSMMKAGATGYLTKWEDAPRIVEGVRKVAGGLRVFSEKALNLWQPMQSVVIELTSRELEVLKQVARGYNNHSIANTLTITVGTVKVYVSRIYRKLGVSTRAQAVAWAWQNGLLTRG